MLAISAKFHGEANTMYLDPIKSVKRKLFSSVLVASTPFAILGYFNVGARMTLYHYNNDIVVYSAFPYCEEVEKCLKELTGKDDNKVSHLVVPNMEHNVAIKSFQEKFPEIKILGLERLESKYEIDYKFDSANANKVLGKEELKSMGIEESTILDNFEFVYLGRSKNKELVLFDKNTKTLNTADLTITVGPASTKLEGYGPETGWPQNKSPFSWASFIGRYLHPGIGYWKTKVNQINGALSEEGRKGIQAVYSWPFETLVCCHGNIQTKSHLAEYYDFLKPSPNL